MEVPEGAGTDADGGGVGVEAGAEEDGPSDPRA